MHPKRIVRVALAALVLGLAGCHASPGNEAAAPMQLKLYRVPPARAEAIGRALKDAFGARAQVSSPSPDALLVYAPVPAQDSIGDVIGALGRAAPDKAQPVQLRVRFWVIDGVPGDGPDDVGLKPLESSLVRLRKAFGPMHFIRDGTVSTMVAEGQGGLIQGPGDGGLSQTFHVQARTLRDERVDTALVYEFGASRIQTRVNAPLGQYLVLAQSAIPCRPHASSAPAPTCGSGGGLRLLVVRIDRANGPV